MRRYFQDYFCNDKSQSRSFATLEDDTIGIFCATQDDELDKSIRSPAVVSLERSVSEVKDLGGDIN